jgi:hypothetical protein
VTKEQFPEILLFPTRIIEEKFKIYPHILEKKGILWSYYVSIFFKTSILSTIFVYLSAERWRFSALFQISKNSISATFPAHFPNRFPAQAPVIFSLSGGILRTRHPRSTPPHLPRHLLFQGYPSQAKPQSTPCTSSQLSALSGGIYGEILGGILVFLLKFIAF